MTKAFKGALLGYVALSAAMTFAAPNYSAQISFENPGGCRAYDMVVDPDCDGSVAPDRCATTAKVLKSVGVEIKNTSCVALHEGNLAQRLLDEFMMGSSSYDGSTLKLEARNAELGETLESSVQTPSTSACADAVAALSALAAQGLNVSAVCNASDLQVTFGE